MKILFECSKDEEITDLLIADSIINYITDDVLNMCTEIPLGNEAYIKQYDEKAEKLIQKRIEVIAKAILLSLESRSV